MRPSTRSSLRSLMAAVFLLLIVGLPIAHAQTGHAVISGSVSDTFNKRNLKNAVVALVNSKDSVFYRHVRSDEQGRFRFNNVAPGRYILMVSYDTFAEYDDILDVSDTAHLALGKIPLTLQARLLEDVTVRQQIAAIRMKGDTMEFKADSFKVQQGATVEDLLKQIPGISVDKDGKITAHGQSVSKVLVDGDEFFGDDPTIATKNLQAAVVDKVQVFDKKSDQAAFTGIDDGQRNKTINLELKKAAKHGYFGKLDLGGGTNDIWNNTVMYNRFRDRLKLSGYGIMSSTGKTGLNFQESSQYGNTSSNIEYSDDGGISIMGGGDDLGGFNGSYYGQGRPKAWGAGLNFSDKYNKDKESLNGSYRYSKLNTEGLGNTFTQITRTDTITRTNEARNSFKSQERHSANATFEAQLDSSSSMKVVASGYTGTNSGFDVYNSSTDQEMHGKNQRVNTNARTTTSTGDSKNIRSNWLFRKKFKKLGRTLSFNIDQQYNASNSDGFLRSVINYFDSTGAIVLKDSTDQRKIYDSRSFLINNKLVYTEPLANRVFMELNYALRYSSSSSERFSYNRDPAGKYLAYDSVYSNSYRFNTLTNTGGVAFKYNGKKITMSVGSDLASSQFHQLNVLKDSVFNRNYVNIFPRASLTWTLTGGARLSVNYTGATRQPSVNQLQPVQDNTNPLNITVGNPYLKQSFNHNISFNFNKFNMLTQNGMYWYGGYTGTANAIVSSSNTDKFGKTVNTYINSDGNFNAYTGMFYNMKLKKPDMMVNAGFNGNASKFENIVNNVKNTTNTYGIGPSLGFNKSKQNKYNFYANGNWNYNNSVSSIQSSAKTNYWTQSYYAQGTVYLPLKFEINVNLQANLREKLDASDQNNNVVLLGAYIGKKILKNGQGLIKISGSDLLDQNKGYSRSINSNIITESNYETIRRYFMVSFVLNFSQTPGLLK